MEGRKLLDAHVFNIQEQIAKPIVRNFVFSWVFLRVVFLFTLLYILGVKKHTLFNKFLSQRRQPF